MGGGAMKSQNHSPNSVEIIAQAKAGREGVELHIWFLALGRFGNSTAHYLGGFDVEEALQKYPEQSFAQKFSLCNRQKFSGRKIKEGF